MSEYVSPFDIYQHGIVAILASRKTAFQEMYVVDGGPAGKALVLDGKWQSCTREEFLYHEPLVHPACIFHGNPKRVLILGGGEGATAREALKWKSVEKVVTVDIDGEVVEACKEHLPEMHQGAYEDPRSELVIGDALVYLDQGPADWDVIISDLSDPIEEGPSFALFTKEYYEKCRKALSPKGYFVLQAGPCSPAYLDMYARNARTVNAVFPNVKFYGSFIPTYAQPWGFVVGSAQVLPHDVDPVAIDKLLAERMQGELKMLDGTTLRGLLHPPKHIREAVAAATEVYTLAAPPKFHGKGVATT